MKRMPLWVEWGWVAIIIVFVAYWVALILVTWPVSNIQGNPVSTIGSIGDSFGALTSLFSGLAVWLAIRLLYQNKIELSDLRKQATLSTLVEKSRLQPQFEINLYYKEVSASDSGHGLYDFLTSHSLNDGDGYFIWTFKKKNENQVYSHPRVVFKQAAGSPHRAKNDRAIYFPLPGDGADWFVIPFDQYIEDAEQPLSCFYFIYRDSTTLPVVMKYRVEIKRDLQNQLFAFYDDTLFLPSFEQLKDLESSEKIERLFEEKYDRSLLLE